MELKEEGNVFFKNEQWRAASKKYHYSLLYIKGLLDSLPSSADSNSLMSALMSRQNGGIEITPEVKEEAMKLSIALSNNLAGLYIK